uniref:Uncharacterized protein n=1 Tax=Quercus lobata TaxID=97700 RepID=A0A7N2LFW0_QUELO
MKLVKANFRSRCTQKFIVVVAALDVNVACQEDLKNGPSFIPTPFGKRWWINGWMENEGMVLAEMKRTTQTITWRSKATWRMT